MRVMHVIVWFLEVWAVLFVASFVIELLVNRRPIVVALVVPIIGFAALLVWDSETINSELGQFVASMYGGIALLGIIPSLAGAGLAIFIRRRNDASTLDKPKSR
jgi:predicted RND superfamily exporter protein